MIRLIILFILLLSFVFSETGYQMKNPTPGALDFTYENNLSNSIQSFNPETSLDKILVQISKQDIISRRENQIFSCMNDTYGNIYCPAALAPASESLEYENGYSVTSIGEVVDYTKKENSTIYTNKTSTTETAPLDVVQIVTGSRAGSYAQWNKTSTANQRAYVMWVAGANGGECWNGWKPFENFKKYSGSQYKNRDNYYHQVDNSKCEYFLGTYNIYGIQYICPPWAQDWEKDETAGNCKKVVVTCPSGYTETIGTETALGECKKSTLACPSGYTETTKGECKKTIEYTYYNYLCGDSTNTQGYNYTPTNSGGNCDKTDPDNTTINSSTLDDSCNSSNPPNNNCSRIEFLCKLNPESIPVWVDNQWQCSPFTCNSNRKCGYGICPSGTTPSDTLFQDVAYNPLGASYNGTCIGEICDYVKNKKISYCVSKQCPVGPEYVSKDGNCYKEECPKGTYMSGSKCISSSY